MIECTVPLGVFLNHHLKGFRMMVQFLVMCNVRGTVLKPFLLADRGGLFQLAGPFPQTRQGNMSAFSQWCIARGFQLRMEVKFLSKELPGNILES